MNLRNSIIQWPGSLLVALPKGDHIFTQAGKVEEKDGFIISVENSYVYIFSKKWGNVPTLAPARQAQVRFA